MSDKPRKPRHKDTIVTYELVSPRGKVLLSREDTLDNALKLLTVRANPDEHGYVRRIIRNY